MIVISLLVTVVVVIVIVEVEEEGQSKELVKSAEGFGDLKEVTKQHYLP